MLERSQFPPGTQLFVVAIPPEGTQLDSTAQTKPRNYHRFVPTREAVELMETQVTVPRLRALAHYAANGEIKGFKLGKHFKDLSSYGSSRAYWLFNPAECDKFFAKPADERVTPLHR